jgi:hypothetical protein
VHDDIEFRPGKEGFRMTLKKRRGRYPLPASHVVVSRDGRCLAIPGQLLEAYRAQANRRNIPTSFCASVIVPETGCTTDPILVKLYSPEGYEAQSAQLHVWRPRRSTASYISARTILRALQQHIAVSENLAGQQLRAHVHQSQHTGKVSIYVEIDRHA